jgi:hypothetical protein
MAQFQVFLDKENVTKRNVNGAISRATEATMTARPNRSYSRAASLSHVVSCLAIQFPVIYVVKIGAVTE